MSIKSGFSKRAPSDPGTIAIGGGKGGIGKSFISSNLAICLSRLGHSVTLVDLDLGGANLHTCLGMSAPKLSLSDFLSNRVSSFTDIVHPAPIPGVYLASGFHDALNIANLNPDSQNKVLAGLREIPTDFIIFDLGAGTSAHTLDFFLSSQMQILAVTPEPTSLENAYRFLKSAFYRKLKLAEEALQIGDLIDLAMDQKNDLGLRTPADLIRAICKSDPSKGALLVDLIKEFRLKIILNQVRTRADVDLGLSVKSVCNKYFGIDAQFLGHLDHDNAVWQALRRRRPLVLEYPTSSLVAQFFRIAKTIIRSEDLQVAA